MTGGHPRRSQHAVACGVFLTATLAMFGDVLLAGNARLLSIRNEDITRPLFFLFPFTFGELAKGNFPLWNPHNYAGTPYFGGFGPAVLYPPHWLHAILPTAFAINLGIALHVFLAGTWVYCWTSYRRLRPAACVLAGLVFMFCGAHFLQIYRGHVHCLTTLTWAPLIFLAVDGILRSFSWKWPLLGMTAVALQILAGHVQYVFYTAIIAGMYALAAWWTSGHRLREAGALAAIYLGGASLAAVQLLTGLQAAGESHRTALSYDVAASFAFPPENLLTLVLPGIFGDLVSTPYWGRWNLSEMSLFVGTAPFLLAVYGVVHGDKTRKRFCLAMALVAIVLALGDYTPLFHLLYDHVPGFANFRGTTKFIFLSSLFTVMLVAVGFDHLLGMRAAPRWLSWTALAAGGILIAAGATMAWDCRAGGGHIWTRVLSLPCFSDAHRRFGVDHQESVRACVNVAGSLLFGGGTFALVGLMLVASPRRRWLVYAVGVVGVVEVMAYARYTRPTFDPALLVRYRDELRRLLEDAGAGDARVLSEDPYSYVAMGAGAFDLWGAEPTVLGRYTRFVQMTQGWHPDAILLARGMRAAVPLFGMLRLRYVLRFAGEHLMLQPTSFKRLPRALLVSRWQVMPALEDVLAAMRNPAFDAERVVLLESDPGIPALASDAPAQPGQVTVTDVSTDVLEVSADAPTPAILVITDNYSASWKATPLPGSSAGAYTVMPANATVRAIPLAAGHHHLRLEYRPTALAVGTWVTIISLIAYAALGGLVWRQARRAHTQP